MIRAIHHTEITVPRDQEAEARAFYCGLLGLREVPKPEALRGRGGFWIQVGPVQLHVGVEEGVDRRATKAHVAYLVEDLNALRRALEARGIAVKDGIPIPGYTRVEIRDPFGNRIELLQETSVPLGS
jgi:catechol 2,3-dioxygenase-like lactoylglutathione lyase family enzyme